ncbi:MAG: hypothetical protein ACRDHZ_10065 [Ktedonobacteraceae bacterium]
MKQTEQLFITLYQGHTVTIPILQDERSGEFVPAGYFEKDAELSRRWMDFRLAEQLRQRGVPVVDPSLRVAGSVITTEHFE